MRNHNPYADCYNAHKRHVRRAKRIQQAIELVCAAAAFVIIGGLVYGGLYAIFTS